MRWEHTNTHTYTVINKLNINSLFDFSLDIYRCIGEGRCKLPTCEFGMYEKKHGRCPRKEDKLAIGFGYNRN